MPVQKRGPEAHQQMFIKRFNNRQLLNQAFLAANLHRKWTIKLMIITWSEKRVRNPPSPARIESQQNESEFLDFSISTLTRIL